MPYVVALLVGAVHAAAVLLAAPGPAAALSVGIVAATAAGAALSTAVSARRAAGRIRLGWSLLSAGLAGWAVGECLRAVAVSVRHTGADAPGLGDAGYLLMIPLSVGAMVVFAGTGRGALRSLLDGLLIAGSLLFLSWTFVLEPVYRAADLTAAAKVVSLAYPLGDVVLATMALILLRRAARGRRLLAALFSAGALAFTAADLGFTYLGQRGAYEPGGLVDTGWVAGLVLMGLSARAADRRRTVPVSRNDVPLLLWLPYLPLAAAVAAATMLWVEDRRPAPLLTVVLAAMVLLTLARQLMALRENVSLSRSLGRTVRELRTREAQLLHLAYHDSLTGLANRALFLERADDGGGAVLFVDLDGFKPVNDAYGHATGDALLVAVAGRLTGLIRETDVAARLGGDEFAVLLHGPHLPTEVDELASRITAALGRPFLVGVEPLRIGASVGTAVREPGEDTAEAMLRRADAEMYAVKARHRAAGMLPAQAH